MAEKWTSETAPRNGKGRGYRRYYYTVKSIAEISGRTIGTVRNDIASGRLEVGNLVSVARYLYLRGVIP